MKDKQIAAASAEPRIFLVSPLLHCVSMTALVYLRFSFGFGFLRPKSVFLAFSWAFALYAIYAWIDRSEWLQHRALLLFGIGAVLLYLSHLLVAFGREWKQTGKHEHYSGTSHLMRLVWLSRSVPESNFETNLHLWAEPTAVLSVYAVLRVIFDERSLSGWLLLATVCLWSKEALNRWFHLRMLKRKTDMYDDTEENVAPRTATNLASEPPRATRKAKFKRARKQL